MQCYDTLNAAAVWGHYNSSRLSNSSSVPGLLLFKLYVPISSSEVYKW